MSSPLELEVFLGTSRAGRAGRCTHVAALEERVVASVEFPADDAPLLAVGARVEIEFVAREPEQAISSEALIVLRTDHPARRTYGFRCDISRRALLHLLSRRRASRVRISPARAPEVKLLGLCEPCPQARLYDLSALGLSILLDPRHEPQLIEKLRLRVGLRLPGAADDLEVDAAIRHRRLLETGVLYGLELDGSSVQERFRDYVASLLEETSPGTPAKRKRGRRPRG